MKPNPYLPHYPPPPQHKGALNKKQMWQKLLTALQVEPKTIL